MFNHTNRTSAFPSQSSVGFNTSRIHYTVLFHTFTIILACFTGRAIKLFCAGVPGCSADLNFIVCCINLPAGRVSAFPFAPAARR